MGVAVTPYLRAIASGREPSGDLRITLIVSPAIGAGAKTSLETWPEDIRAYFEAGVDNAGRFQVNIDFGGGEPVPARAVYLEKTRELAAARTAIARIWQAAIDPRGKRTVWSELADRITSSLKSASTKGAFGRDGENIPAAPATESGKHPVSSNAEVEGGDISVTSVIPVKQGDIAFYKEFERAAAVARRLAGLPLPEVDPEPEMRGKVDAAGRAEQTTENLLKDRWRFEFDQLVKDTAADRANARGWWKDLACAAAQPEQDVTDALDGVVMGASGEAGKAASSHRYGYYPQEDALANAEGLQAANMPLRMALAAYYAISSSPAWSRLFGFAVDVVVSQKDIPAAGKVKLKVQVAGIAGLPSVSTWAEISETGFWPSAAIDSCTDIRGAFIDLSTRTGTGEPRHEILTLDVRRVVEADRFYGSAAHERPQFYKSAGLTLIDRGRARATVRTLKRAEQACDACATGGNFDVDAEDLMVGMRLRVGLKGQENTHWRSLAERIVSYRLHDDGNPGQTARLIETLLGSPGSQRRRMIDQAILTTATRLVPVTADGKTGQAREAIVEQALATWDGAPMAVYCGEDAQARDAVDDVLELGLSTECDLSRETQKLLLPLRYSRCYRNAMQPVYVSGICDVDGAVDERYATAARCFLRHESLGAPIILLPEATAKGIRSSPMDFERHQTATLRSSVSVPGGEAGWQETADPTINGRQYVSLSRRLSGEETIRVVMPPEASLDELMRHGFLDRPEARAAALDGGMKKVAFGFPPDLSGEDAPAARFPAILTQTRTGFDDMPIELVRKLGWSKQPDPQRTEGETAHDQGTGVFAARSRISHRRAPYRPDPMAEDLFIRFRHAGTAILAGDTIVIRSDQLGRYPNRKPVVLRVRKLAQVRPRPDGGPSFRVSSSTYDGLKIGASEGEAVVVVDLQLMRGDDFETDIFYLPSAQRLADSFAVVETLGAMALVYSKRKLKPGETDEAETLARTLRELGAKDGGSGGPMTTRGLDVPSNLTEIAEKLVRTITARANVPELAAFETIRLVHAVNRPIAAPVLVKGLSAARPAPVKASTEAGAGATRSREWSKRESAGASVALTKDYLLVGDLKFHAATTGVIEIEATTVSPRDPVFDNPERKRALRARLSGTWPMRFDAKGDRVDASVLDVYGFGSIDRDSGKVTLAASRVVLLRIELPGHPAALPAEILKGIDDDGMATIDLAAVHALARAGEVLVGDDGAPVLKAAQVHAFPDGRARGLTLRAVAYSRFGADFHTAPFWDGSNTRSKALLRQELQRQDLRRIGNEVFAWMPATARPLKCDAEAPVPMFSLTRPLSCATDCATVLELTRHAKTRIYLKRSWYSSGEGERVGLVLWPPTIFSTDAASAPNMVKLDHRDEWLDVTDLTDSHLGIAGPVVTRWGGDPTRKDRAEQTETLIPKSAFLDAALSEAARAAHPHNPEPLSNVIVPIRLPGRIDDATDAFLPLEAALLTYVPCFDTDREAWFVDVDLEVGNAANPFVRFGLVRFQPNAVGDLHVSEPVVVWSQLLPDRTLTVESAVKGGELEISSLTLRGMASTGIRELVISPDVRKALAKKGIRDPYRDLRAPHVRVWLVHEAADTSGLRRSLVDPAGTRYRMRGDATGKGHTVWAFGKITVPLERLDELGEGTVYVYVEERDLRMPATYVDHRWQGEEAKPKVAVRPDGSVLSFDTRPAHDTRSSHRTVREPVTEDDMYDDASFIASGPSFAGRIEIYRHKPVPAK